MSRRKLTWLFLKARRVMCKMTLTVERIVDKLAELSDNGTKAVCLTCENPRLLALKNFVHDHSGEIARMARARYPFFGSTGLGGFWLGMRGYFWVPECIVETGTMFPPEYLCVNFPLSEV